MRNRLKATWAAGHVAIVGGVATGGVLAAEIMARQGYDALYIDMQHAPQDMACVRQMIQAIEATDCTPVVRVPWLDPGVVMQALDAGALGVVCPMINSAEECRRFVACCYYAPRGMRSWGPYRQMIHRGRPYFDEANDLVLPIAMIETAAAIENLDAILAVPGLRGLYVGPNDLAVSLGLPPAPDFADPVLLPALDRIIAAAKRAGVPAGFSCPTRSDAELILERGADMIWGGSDASLLREGANRMVAALRERIVRRSVPEVSG